MSAPPSPPSKALVLGTGGHVDHGKTTLVRALTGVDTDRWEEEKARGLTIDIGFARLDLGAGLEVGVVDVPGHEDFLKNMLAGATGIDLLLLAVAADEGPMPQTREHLAIARLLGVDRGVVALTKVDRVEEDWLALVEEAVREELERVLGHARWPRVPVSPVTGRGLDRLREVLREAADPVEDRPLGDLFRLPVDRSFSVHGTGTVVTGTVWSGRVRTGDRLAVWPRGPGVRVRTLQVHGEERSEVGAGRRCAMALVGVDPGDVPRGSAIVGGPEWPVPDRLGVRISLLRHGGRRLEHGQRVRVYLGTREAMARVGLPDRSSLGPGDTSPALLRLEAPLPARARDRFVVRFYSPVTTIGGGRVAEVDPGGPWRERVEAWVDILDGDAPAAFRAAVRLAGAGGVERAALPHRTGLPAETVERVARAAPGETVEIDGRWFDAGALERLRGTLASALEAMHARRPRAPRVSREALRGAAPREAAPELVERALESLEAEGRVVSEGPGVRLPTHTPRLTSRERDLREELLDRLAAGGLEPPTVTELAESSIPDRELLHDLLQLLEEEGRVVAVSPELYLAAEHAERMEREARALLARRSPAPPTAFKEVYGITRKYLIPILEYLDRRGVTRRTGEGREPVG